MGSERSRRPWIVGLVVVTAILAPVVRDKQADSYPLSNYPMFTADQPEVATFVRALGADGADGSEWPLPPEISGGTVEVVHANRTLRRAVREGQASAMCREISARAAGLDDAPSRVLIVGDEIAAVAALRTDDPPIIRRVIHAECRVETTR